MIKERTSEKTLTPQEVRTILKTDNKEIVELCKKASIKPRKNEKGYTYFSYDEVRNQIYSYESAADWKGVTYATCDYDGDGKTEVWFADEGQPGKLVKLYMNQNGQYTYYQMRQCFDSNCILFTGDFNGDGCTDFLTFHSDRKVEGWEIVLGGV